MPSRFTLTLAGSGYCSLPKAEHTRYLISNSRAVLEILLPLTPPATHERQSTSNPRSPSQVAMTKLPDLQHEYPA